jgi:hypothetical protein
MMSVFCFENYVCICLIVNAFLADWGDGDDTW